MISLPAGCGASRFSAFRPTPRDRYRAQKSTAAPLDIDEQGNAPTDSTIVDIASPETQIFLDGGSKGAAFAGPTADRDRVGRRAKLWPSKHNSSDGLRNARLAKERTRTRDDCTKSFLRAMRPASVERGAE